MKVLSSHIQVARSAAATPVLFHLLIRTNLAFHVGGCDVANDVIYMAPRPLSSLRPGSYACLSAATGLWERHRGYLIEAKGGGI